MRKNHYWVKIISYAATLSALLFVGSTQFANALSPSDVGDFFLNGAYTFVGKVVFAIVYVIAAIGGIGIAVEAWVIGVILNINTTVFSSQVVQSGFSVTLSIANLGFVLGIIIIAIATILRRETYGYKTLLWKLVVAAIFVNFSLVIISPIFNLGNSFTTYFLNCIDPSAGGCSGVAAGSNSMNDFAKTLAGAFNPQKEFLSINNINDTGGAAQSNTNGAFSAVGQDIGKMIVPIFSVVFVLIEVIITAIVLAVFAVQLLIRYIYIAILAILMPFAWLGWVFPSMSNWWTKWWSKFIQWTFFAPVVVFFIYLSIQTAKTMSINTSGAAQFATYASKSNMMWAAISDLLSNIFSPMIQNFLNILVLGGLSIGGMIVANSMGIAVAGAAIKAAQNVGGKATEFANKQRKKAQRAAIQKIDKSFNLTDRLQEGKIPGLKYIPFGRRGASYAGQGLANVQKGGGEHLVEHEMKWAKETASNPQEAKRILSGDLNDEKKIALIRALMERQDLDDPKQTVNGVALGKFIAENKNLITHDYGQFNFYDKELRKVGINEQASQMAALVAAGKLDETIKDEDGKDVTAEAGLRNSMKDKLVSKLKTEDAKKIDMNGMLSESYLEHEDEEYYKANKVKVKANKARVEMFLQQLGAYNYQMVPALIRTLKGKQVSTFSKMYTAAMAKERAFQESQPDSEDKKTALDNLTLAQNNFKAILVNLAKGSGSGSRGGDKTEAPSAEPAGDGP